MSNLQQLLTPNENNKPWAKIFVDTITARESNITDNMEVESLEIKENLLVGGYSNTSSNQETIGMMVLTTNYPDTATLPANTGGDVFTYCKPLNKVVFSGLSGNNTAAASTTNESEFIQLTTPFTGPSIGWSDDLGLFSGLAGFGTAVYTSPTAVNGSWVIGTPLSVPGASFGRAPIWYPAFQKFFTPVIGVGATRMATSTDGSSYTLIPATRDTAYGAYAPASSGLGTGLGRLVRVGAGGTMYTDDGKAFINGNSVASMSSVAYSSFWNKFTAIPRNVNLRDVYESKDGINWVTITNAFKLGVSNLRNILYIDQLQVYIAQGDTDIYLSKDGITWKKSYQSVPIDLDIYGAAYIEEWGQLLSGGVTSNLAVSSRRYNPV